MLRPGHDETIHVAGEQLFLPFLYDEEAAKVREANAAKLEGGSSYKAFERAVSAAQS